MAHRPRLSPAEREKSRWFVPPVPYNAHDDIYMVHVYDLRAGEGQIGFLARHEAQLASERYMCIWYDNHPPSASFLVRVEQYASRLWPGDNHEWAAVSVRM